jgi:hypothetical protein
MGTLCILMACVLSDTQVIRWQDAPEYMNKTVTVRMKVARSVWSGKFTNYCGHLYPHEDRSGKGLSVDIAKTAFDLNSEKPWEMFDGQTIEVTGTILPQNPKNLVPRLRVDKRSQIKVVEDDE